MNRHAASPVMRALANAPEGDGYSLEDLMLVLGADASTVDADLRLQEKAGRIVLRQGVWFVCDKPIRPKPAKAKGLVPSPAMGHIDDEIAEARHQASEWSKHLRALEAYARTVSR